MNYIRGLNDMQKEAVLHNEGPLLILAGAGSGKTKVLTHRIAYLVKERAISPYNILSITFTNKAADEMKERINALLGEDISGLWAGTFHSICVRILRMNIEKIGFDSSFTIYDRRDQLTVVKDSFKRLNIDDKMFKENTILTNISRIKDKMISPEEYLLSVKGNYYQEIIGKFYKDYDETLRKNNALDFDDLIIKTVQLLEENPDILDYYSNKFEYIFVDEFQDTNGPQYQLISLLAKKHRNLCVVGDDDQSIYSFRGANIENILNFEKEFKDAKVIKLEQNYRSTQNILNAANHVIKNNYERKDKELWTENDPGKKVNLVRLDDSDEEARFVVNRIRELVEEGKYDYSDIAILYRTNAQSRNFEDYLREAKIPHKLVGGQRFYDRMEIKDVMSYLNLIQNPMDDMHFKRIINNPKRGIGDASIAKIEAHAAKTGESLYSAILSADQIEGLSKRAINNLEDFTNIINELIAAKYTLGIQDFLEKVLVDTGYTRQYIEDKSIESKTRLENIEEFLSVATKYEEENPDAVAEDFLIEIALLSDLDKTEDVKNSVTMLTVHSSKGLEYPVVFMVGMEEGLFPISRALDKEEDIEEERRLCYVAMTRAEELLFITYTKLRTIYGRTNYALASRFIDELPKKLVETNTEEKTKRVRSARDSRRSLDYSKFKLEREQKLIEEKRQEKLNNQDSIEVNPGDKVEHKAWGIGTVVEVKEMKGDLQLVVAFENKGIKKLLLSIAPIKIL